MEDLERKITENIYKFDIVLLLKLLYYLGYPQEEIMFKSHYSITSQAHLIHSIEFKKKPIRQVLINLNLGLLSSQSPLPNYFNKQIDYSDNGAQSFIDFIGFLDHQLIYSYIFSIYPEMQKSFLTDWELTKRRYMQMLDFKSNAVLHWFFQLVFPEFGVSVRKANFKRNLETSPIKLGATVLGGESVFGEEVSVTVPGSEVTLLSEGEFTYSGEPWSREIKKRMDEQIFPIIKVVDFDLKVSLIIQSQKKWVRLHKESYLGYDKIRGGKSQYRKIQIFLGRTKAC